MCWLSLGQLRDKELFFYRKSFIKPQGELFISTTFEGRGGVFKGGWRGGADLI